MAAVKPAVGITAAAAVSITVVSFLLLSNRFSCLQFVKKKKKSLKNPRGSNSNKGLIAAIGNTPLIRINSLSDATGCEILGKAEFLNPGGSVKDRVAVKIIEEALDSGDLVRGGVVTEGSAGSTAISLATVAPAYGCKCHVVIPDDAAIEKGNSRNAAAAGEQNEMVTAVCQVFDHGKSVSDWRILVISRVLKISLPEGALPTTIVFSEGASSVVVAAQVLSGSSLYMYGDVIQSLLVMGGQDNFHPQSSYGCTRRYMTRSLC